MNTGMKTLLVLLLAYAAATVIHFVHNAEFLRDYPGLPETWTRAGVYLAWAGMTLVGVAGWMLLRRGFRITGLVLLAVYAALGLDSLGHYVIAPLSAHTVSMNSTILLEVTAAALVMVEVVRQMVRRR